MSDAITIRGLTKTFGEKVAVRDLDLVVPTGSLCGFIGPNGAGKTTTLRMIMSILFPDRGELTVLGRRSALESKDRIGYLPEERGIYRKMKVGAFLTYMARIKGVVDPDLAGRITRWLERVGLGDVQRKKCEELSKGMQQKVQFLAAILHEPDLLILDEPFSGLDPVNMRVLRDLIDEQHRAGKTVIVCTHVMQQAETLCDHIFMIHDGQKVLDSSMPALRQRFDHRTILVEPVPGTDDRVFAGLPGIRSVERTNGTVELALELGTTVQEAIRAVAAAAPVTRIELRRATLEDVFVEIVTGSGRSDETSLREALRQGRT